MGVSTSLTCSDARSPCLLRLFVFGAPSTFSEARRLDELADFDGDMTNDPNHNDVEQERLTTIFFAQKCGA